MSISGYTCIRFVFCWVNVLFWISGCGLLGVGLWLRIAYEGYASLLPQYALLSADSLAIAFGTITFIYSFFACCGSWFQSRCMLITYFILVVFIFVAEFILGSLAFIFRDGLRHTLSEELVNGLRHHYNVTATGPHSLVYIWDKIQTQFHCCGVNNYEDWYMIDAWPKERWIPDACCLPANYDVNCGKVWGADYFYSQGCYSQIHNFFIRRLDIVGVVGITIAFIQTLVHFISSSCHRTKQQFRQASLDVYEALVELSALKTHGHNWKTIQESLVLLTHALTTRPFSFSAAGFFEVDNTLMFTLIGSISYYVAIFIQFK